MQRQLLPFDNHMNGSFQAIAQLRTEKSTGAIAPDISQGLRLFSCA
ncbi:hypothetical protein [Nostoc sp. LPT]|nr:hypothetical protein [Nostoc sp. LPT]MBN4003813.1 hypothetical protein [Nostoc sp. LPT]